MTIPKYASDGTRLGDELAELERTNPAVAKARHNYEQAREAILRMPSPPLTRISKYLTAHGGDVLPNRKTRSWGIQGNDGAVLGTVGWYGAWRQYTFNPTPGTTFNRDCLIDLANFLRRVNDEHRAQIRNTARGEP